MVMELSIKNILNNVSGQKITNIFFMLKIFISLFFLLFTFQANANDKYKTNIDWYSKDQVKYWFNDNFWKRFISKTLILQ